MRVVIELYFVARFKHDRVQGLAAGPFVDYDKASDARYELEQAATGTFTIVRAEIPAVLTELESERG